MELVIGAIGAFVIGVLVQFLLPIIQTDKKHEQEQEGQDRELRREQERNSFDILMKNTYERIAHLENENDTLRERIMTCEMVFQQSNVNTAIRIEGAKQIIKMYERLYEEHDLELPKYDLDKL